MSRNIKFIATEDADIELELIKKLPVNTEQENKMLMVCSGGDTLIHILSHNPNLIKNKKLKIDVIDSNKLQIALCIFKLLVLHFINNNEKDMGFYLGDYHLSKVTLYEQLMHGGKNIDYVKLLDTLCQNYQNLDYCKFIYIWKEDKYLQMLQNGIIFQGELERTFRNLIKSDMNFNHHFDHKILEENFGTNALQLSSNCSFSQKFEHIFKKYKMNHGNKYTENRFYYRMVHGYEDTNVQNKILDDGSNITYQILESLHFINQDMLSYVKETNNQYDIIQVSNVTDWLESVENIIDFVKNISRICRSDDLIGRTNERGKMLWRSLNGDYDLEKILRYDHNYCENELFEQKEDKSYFYKKIIISYKKNTINDVFQMVDKFVNWNNTITHGYFSKLNLKTNNLFTLSQFLNTQIQFYFAVEHWVIALLNVSKILISLNEHTMNNLLNDNINDELGLHSLHKNDELDSLSKITDNENKKHTETFKDFLFAMAENIDQVIDIDSHKTQCINDFNDKMDKIIETKSLSYICAYLGTIEYQYILVSKIIKDFVDMHNISQSHYEMHELLDKKHASDLYFIAIHFHTDINKDINNGAYDGYIDFMELYNKMILIIHD